MDDKELSESKDIAVAESATVRKVKRAPPQAPPSEAKEEDSKGKENGTVPASGGEKKKKKALPPPGNPPPQSASTSAAAAFRAKSALPLPNGPPPGAATSASVAKVRGAARPPSAGMGPPPSMKTRPPPPTESAPETKGGEEGGEMDAKVVAAAVQKAPARALSSEEKSPPKPNPQPKPQPKPQSQPPRAIAKSVDPLCDDSPLLDVAIASAPTANSLSSSKISQPPSATPTLMRGATSTGTVPLSTRTSQPPPPSQPPIVKKSTLEVLNDTNATLTKHRGLHSDSPETKRNEFQNSDIDPSSRNYTTPSSIRTAPWNGNSLRPNVPDEEIILVKKQITIRSEDEKAVDLDDSMDELEEIPCLDSADPKRIEAEEDDEDPVIVVERSGSRTNSGNMGSRESKKQQEEVEKELPRESIEKEDVYNELRKLKRCTGSHHEEGEEESEAKRTVENGQEEESKGTSRSERRSERRREKRRTKSTEEETTTKRITPQFYNPKNVPYVPDHLLEFVKRPLECGRGHIIKCFIERNDAHPNKLAPVYTLLLEVNSSSGRPIMYARKQATSRITSHYVISLNKEDLYLSRMMRSHQYIGKLRSSMGLLDYCLYDQGDNPEDIDSDCEIDEEIRKSIRAELAVIQYHHSKKSYGRKMEVLIPSITADGKDYLEWRPITRDQMMEEHMKGICHAGGQNVLDPQNFTFMHKRETKYDPLSSCIVDFRSRATCVSVKNFQLVHSEPANETMKAKYAELHPDYVYEDQGTVSLPQEHVLLQLGKVGKDCFNMDFQYPLSMLQAFAICLSRFDTKQR